MVYEVYGNYVEGLEDDAKEMLDYFGKDFVLPRKKRSPVPLRDSTGDSLLNSVITAGIL
jgi:integrase